MPHSYPRVSKMKLSASCKRVLLLTRERGTVKAPPHRRSLLKPSNVVPSAMPLIPCQFTGLHSPPMPAPCPLAPL